MVDNTLAPAASGYAGIGTASPRIEARQKVTGDARYGSDFAGGQSPAYAYLATSAIALGRITQLDEAAARAVPGVLDILTYKNVGNRVQPGKIAMNKSRPWPPTVFPMPARSWPSSWPIVSKPRAKAHSA
jgi:CO/xanthine dehydrogenase Mo-binding subunit